MSQPQRLTRAQAKKQKAREKNNNVPISIPQPEVVDLSSDDESYTRIPIRRRIEPNSKPASVVNLDSEESNGRTSPLLTNELEHVRECQKTGSNLTMEASMEALLSLERVVRNQIKINTPTKTTSSVTSTPQKLSQSKDAEAHSSRNSVPNFMVGAEAQDITRWSRNGSCVGLKLNKPVDLPLQEENTNNAQIVVNTDDIPTPPVSPSLLSSTAAPKNPTPEKKRVPFNFDLHLIDSDVGDSSSKKKSSRDHSSVSSKSKTKRRASPDYSSISSNLKKKLAPDHRSSKKRISPDRSHSSSSSKRKHSPLQYISSKERTPPPAALGRFPEPEMPYEVPASANEEEDRCGTEDAFSGVFSNLLKSVFSETQRVPSSVKPSAASKAKTAVSELKSNLKNKTSRVKNIREDRSDASSSPSSSAPACNTPTSEFENLMRNLIDSPSSRPARSPGRSRKGKAAKKNGRKRSSSFLEDDDDIEVEEMEVEDLIFEDDFPFTVRIQWNAEQKMRRFTFVKKDLCRDIKRKLSAEVGVPYENIDIYFPNVADALVDSQTLAAAQIGIGTILNARNTKQPQAPTPMDKKNMITLKLQCGDHRRLVTLTVNKTDTFQEIREKYAQKADVQVSSIKFIFDGETLDWDETPLDQDLEGDECIDVVISTS